MIEDHLNKIFDIQFLLELIHLVIMSIWSKIYEIMSVEKGMKKSMFSDLNCAKIMFAYKQAERGKNEEKMYFLIVKIYLQCFA